MKERLDNIVKNGFPILVGDANGADKAVQKHLSGVAYADVEVFCSGAGKVSYGFNMGKTAIDHLTPIEIDNG